MRHLQTYKIFEDAGKHDFGCVMVYFDHPLLKAIHKLIDKDHIYTGKANDKRSYGLEKEQHTTLLYGLHDEEVEVDDVFKRAVPNEFKPLRLHNVSCFNNAEYDVLKFDVDAKWLGQCNKKLRKLPHTNEYPDYHPHATIGYIKPGKGKEYCDMLWGLELMVLPGELVYSMADGKKERRPIDCDKPED